MRESLQHCPLFAGFTLQEIADCLRQWNAQEMVYEKEQTIFRAGDRPQGLLILLEGAVRVGNYAPDGTRRVVATFTQPGELFGEVFLFLPDTPYEQFAEAASQSYVLQLPKDFLEERSFGRIAGNLLTIFAKKAYFLNQRVQVLTCGTLRQKLACMLLQYAQPDGRVYLPMGREALAGFVGAARPSVSRELSHMQADGFIRLERREIQLLDCTALQALL